MPVGQTGEKHINNPGDSMYYDPIDDVCFSLIIQATCTMPPKLAINLRHNP